MSRANVRDICVGANATSVRSNRTVFLALRYVRHQDPGAIEDLVERGLGELLDSARDVLAPERHQRRVGERHIGVGFQIESRHCQVRVGAVARRV